MSSNKPPITLIIGGNEASNSQQHAPLFNRKRPGNLDSMDYDELFGRIETLESDVDKLLELSERLSKVEKFLNKFSADAMNECINNS